MITVSCPNCDATYQLDESKLADGGRKLKCAKCQTVWIAKRPEVEPVVSVVEETPVVEEEVAPVVEAVAEGDIASPEDAPPTEEMIVQRTPGVDALVRVGGWRQYVRGGNIWRTGAMTFILLGVVAGGFVAYGKMTAQAPERDGVDESSHGQVVSSTMLAETKDTSQVVQPPKGVVLHRVRGEATSVEGKNGGVALTVRGLLSNTTSDSIVVPAMQLELLGDDGKVADLWPVSGVSGTLQGGAEQAWTVSLTAPDMSAVKGWRVVFVKNASGQGAD